MRVAARGWGRPGGFLPADPGVSACRCENQELRRMVTLSNQESAKREAAEQQQVQGQRCPRRGWGGSREPADTWADIPHLI